jgi:DnaA regulatory inactivator Hda
MAEDCQLVLDLGHRPAFGRDDFLVTPGNSEAVEWIDRWPSWPGHVLAIFGPAGCGKSHLAQVFALRASAPVLAAADVCLDAVAALIEAHRALVLEDGESLADPRGLLHLFNAMKEQGGYLLLTSKEPPARWPVVLADLKSRISSVPAVRIASPDDAMIEAVLVKLFADRQLDVAPDVIAYLLRRMDRSFAAARQVVALADAASLADKRGVTIPLVKKVLDTL